MQEIYVIKVKTRPEVSKLYPSERRYSATTVAGLGLVHLLLGATILLLATLGLASQADSAPRYGGGVALGVAAVATACVAFLAWRRWYIDDNIRYFLVVSIIGVATSLLCLTSTGVALIRVEASVDLPPVYTTFDASNNTDATDAPPTETTPDVDAANATLAYDGDVESETTRVVSGNVLLVNILVACVLETCWCVLSVRVAWRGVNSDYNNATPGEKGVHKPPDIIDAHHRAVTSDVRKCEYLPQDESSGEYEERVRRFLASHVAVGVE